MKKPITLILFSLVCFNVLGQLKPDSIGQSEKKSTEINGKVQLVLQDTLHLQQNTQTISSDSSWSKNMPWIAALLIGLLSAFVNFWLGFKQRKSNEKILQDQISNAKDISITQFKATIATKNRQEWINDLRHSLSEFLINAAFNTPDLTANKTVSEVKEITQKVGYNRYRIELLLNKNKPEQKRLYDAVENMSQLFLTTAKDFDQDKFKRTRLEIMNAAVALFDIHWKKIKALQ